jgi:hypothetical protein
VSSIPTPGRSSSWVGGKAGRGQALVAQECRRRVQQHWRRCSLVADVCLVGVVSEQAGAKAHSFSANNLF